MKLIALVGAALLLAGCSAQPISDEEFIDNTSGLASFDGMSDADRLSYARDYCQYLTDHGGGTEQGRRDAAELFLAVDSDRGGDVAETAIVLGYAVQRFCPEYQVD